MTPSKGERLTEDDAEQGAAHPVTRLPMTLAAATAAIPSSATVQVQAVPRASVNSPNVLQISGSAAALPPGTLAQVLSALQNYSRAAPDPDTAFSSPSAASPPTTRPWTTTAPRSAPQQLKPSAGGGGKEEVSLTGTVQTGPSDHHHIPANIAMPPTACSPSFQTCHRRAAGLASPRWPTAASRRRLPITLICMGAPQRPKAAELANARIQNGDVSFFSQARSPGLDAGATNQEVQGAAGRAEGQLQQEAVRH
ncbi:zinc fingers and homeoboxes protein 1-like protein [Lates japonicus]|uniref:Zinc fingers and homeoboxes protein 1-like protein n=1 Tax=Lates japonicus TaxID=270547 RepID=A0AAD3MSS2_LATJO|nr:zinc fingers and homeoboxes protein 1-like protein [Lates japonicus]